MRPLSPLRIQKEHQHAVQSQMPIMQVQEMLPSNGQTGKDQRAQMDCLSSVIVPRTASTRDITVLETAMQGLALDDRHPIALELTATATSRHFLLRATSPLALRHLECERRYRVGEQWYNLRPDALAEYRIGSKQIRFWLEWDRGTMNGRDLAIKFSSYVQYTASREWARERSLLPLLLCVAPDIAQERRMQRVAQAAFTRTHGLGLWTTTEVLLNQQGPLSPIWLQGMPQSYSSGQRGSLLRRCLSDMGSLCRDNTVL